MVFWILIGLLILLVLVAAMISGMLIMVDSIWEKKQ
jgi:uncharacterized SAM-binding protein YcdF (DUF218 family)